MNKELWFDARNIKENECKDLVSLAANNGYQGIMIKENQKKLIKIIPTQCKILLFVTKETLEASQKLVNEISQREYIVFAENEDLLKDFDCEKGLFLSVNDKESLDETVEMTNHYKHVIISFNSATNIPLELVLAFSQKNHCSVCKKVVAGEDGWIATMVMEMGSNSVLLETKNMKDIIDMKEKIDSLNEEKMEMVELVVLESKHIGIGDRVCIDTTSLLKADEGIILGSTSGGGFLVSSETHYLPYMELRPFRVNAGAIHLYAWNKSGNTDYLSELKAGSQIMVVDSKGNTRQVAVGRIKMERRPMLLIRAEDSKHNEVNVVLQDDWHVRVIGIHGEAINCTELKFGDKVLGYTCASGRHVGIKINENIVEK